MIYLDNASTTKPQKAAREAVVETFEKQVKDMGEQDNV